MDIETKNLQTEMHIIRLEESERVRRLAIARLGNRIHMTNAQGHLDENH